LLYCTGTWPDRVYLIHCCCCETFRSARSLIIFLLKISNCTLVLFPVSFIAVARLLSCVRDLQERAGSCRLRLNASKRQLIWFGSRSSLSRLKPEDRTLEIGATVVKPTDVVRDLGVLLDSELTMKRHVNKTVSPCFYHLRRLRQLQRHVDIDTMKQLVSAFIFSRLDYCNAVLYGLPQSTIGRLQRV